MRFFAALLFCASLSAAKLPSEQDQQLARAIFKELVEIQSGYTTGSTTPVAEAVAARMRAAGFPAADIFVGGAAPKKANVVVRYRGTGVRRPLLLLAHEDVVEAKREDWSMDPFRFVEKDGFFYGRGTVDDKAQAAVWVATLLRFKRENFRPDRDIILALTADEEGGGPFSGIQWLLKNHRELIDAELCFNEGSMGEIAAGKHISNDLQLSEKWYVNFRLEVRNKGGHSSQPVPDNAIYHLAGALDRLAKFAFPIKTNEATKAYFAQFSRIEGRALQADLAKTAAQSPLWNSMLRTTCVATQLEGGHAPNALPQLAAGNVNCRVLPEDSLDYVSATLKKIFADDQVIVKVTGDVDQAPGSPLRSDVVRTITRISETSWPGIPVVPVMVPWATDGRYLREAGIPTYGIQGFPIDRDDTRMHGQDERMPVQSFYQGQEFLYGLVKAMGTAE